MDAIKTEDIIESMLASKCEVLEDKLAGDVIIVQAPMLPGVR